MRNLTTDESERNTRKRLIDPKLRTAGWRVVRFDPRHPFGRTGALAIEEFPTDNGPADYALCVDGHLLGVVEAKKVTLGPQNVLTQAERYSRGATQSPLNFHGFRVPFLYSTNGEVLRHHDVRHPQSRSRRIARFHTPDALQELLTRDAEAACEALLQTPNDHPRLRPYQTDANAAVERALAERKRHMLVAMATGTGKTFTMVNQVYRLMKAGVARRVLFLVDRRALAAQAAREFASFEAEPGKKFTAIYELYTQKFRREDLEDEPFDPNVLPASYLTAPKPGMAFVYISTIQRMTINLFGREAVFGPTDEDDDTDADTLDIPIHAFDLVIADECHRGYTAGEVAVWRNTLEHFDAIKIGLTATPAAHTTSYFTNVVFRYEYERGVREGHLVGKDLLDRLLVERESRWSERNPRRRYKGPEPPQDQDDDLPEIPESWTWTNFDHCSWEITVGHVGPMRDRYTAEGMSFLRCQNIRPLRFDPAGLVHIPMSFHRSLAKSRLTGGEILVVRSGANTGDCCVFPREFGEANCADLVITRPLSGLLSEYGALYVSSPFGQARLTLRETGIAQPHFNIGAMRVKAFPLPPFAEQEEIARRVQGLFRLADAIERRMMAGVARAEKLTRAILSKAFRGELVPTEADLARAERRPYESASALLARIRLPRAADPVAGRFERRSSRK
jgi:hypothetical protein